MEEIVLDSNTWPLNDRLAKCYGPPLIRKRARESGGPWESWTAQTFLFVQDSMNKFLVFKDLYGPPHKGIKNKENGGPYRREKDAYSQPWTI